MGKYFGTDGIRGKANVFPMSPDFVLRLGQAIGLYFKRETPHPKILIGKDTRRSGYMLEQALCSGICSVGVDTFFLGPLPTPGIAYLTRGLRANAGIVLSASHNPYDDNGIKIFSSDGFKLPDAHEDELERLLEGATLTNKLPTGGEIGRARRVDDAIGQYAVFLKEQFPKHLSLDGLRIVIDCAHGSSYKVAPKVFAELGAEVFVIGDEPNGVNINENCGALYPQSLRERVMLYKADVGFAFDGDADRLVVVDDKAEMVDGDEVLAICGSYMMERKRLANNAIVSTVMSNMGLDIAMQKVGGSVIRTKVGDRYVMEEMRKGNYNLGGEQSGHLIFKDCSTTGDGILAALNVIQVMLEKDKKVSELKRCFERLPQVLKNIEVSEKVPLQELPDLAKMIQNIEKKLGKEGRVLFRYSGTESVARIMVEGTDKTVIEDMAAEICTMTAKAISDYRNARL